MIVFLRYLVICSVCVIFGAPGFAQHMPEREILQSRQLSPTEYQIPASPEAISGQIKFEESFADSTAMQQWTIINADGSFNNSVGGFTTYLIYSNGDSIKPQVPGTYFWASNFSNANGNLLDEWLVSPQLPALETGDTLYFWGGAIGGGYDDSVQVRLATENPQGNISAFVHSLGRYKMAGPLGNWTRYAVPLDSALWRGQPVWIALRYWHSNGGATGAHSDNVWLDHIILVNNPSTGIQPEKNVAETFELHQNYPNPFNPSTTIPFRLEKSASVKLTVFDIDGKIVATLVNKTLTAGEHSVRWNGQNDQRRTVANGVYFYQLSVENADQTRKMILLK